MKIRNIFLIFLLLIFVFTGMITVYSSENNAMVLNRLEGEVYYKPPGWFIFSGNWNKVEDWVEIEDGNLIKTGKEGKAELYFLEEARIIICPDTKVKVEEDRTGELKVKRLKLTVGEVIINFIHKLKENSGFEVETPSAVAGIRGTTFRVSVGKDKTTRVSVFEGEVRVSTEKAVKNVRENNFAIITAESKKAEIADFNKQERTKWQQDNKLLKETEKKNEEMKEKVKELKAEKAKHNKNKSEQKKDNPSSPENKPENIPDIKKPE